VESEKDVAPQAFVSRFESPSEVSEPPSFNAMESRYQSGSHLSPAIPPRNAARSPLPVENDTVHGHEDLFDDDNTSSYYNENEEYEGNFDPTLHGSNIIISDRFASPYDHDDFHLRQGSDHSYQSTSDVEDEPFTFDDGDPETKEGAKTPSLVPVHHDIQDVSPFALKHDSPATPNRGGLSASRHAPGYSPQTPSNQLEPEAEPEVDSEAFMPRDVTNLPWHVRNDSTPQSLHSQSTLSSTPSSPFQSEPPADKHEPVIRDSWPISSSNGTRPRADTQLTDRTGGQEFDPFGYDVAKPIHTSVDSPSRTTEIDHPQPQSNRGLIANSPSFNKLRSMFESPGGSSAEASPSRSRGTSVLPLPTNRDRSSSLRKSISLSESYHDETPRRGGFSNEDEDEDDEHSALLRSGGGSYDN
jgi:hypothetical protein